MAPLKYGTYWGIGFKLLAYKSPINQVPFEATQFYDINSEVPQELTNKGNWSSIESDLADVMP